MGRRGTWQYKRQERERRAKKQVDPTWRGVGCVLIAIIAGAAFWFSGWFLQQNAIENWVFLPADVMNPTIPYVGDALAGGNMVRLVVSLFFALAAFGVVNVLYAILFPKQPGEFDVPKPRKRRKQPKSRY